MRPAAGGCRWRTRSAPGCSTRPGSPARGWASGPADLGRLRRATCPARSACSRWGTARPAAASRRRDTSTRPPARSTPPSHGAGRRGRRGARRPRRGRGGAAARRRGAGLAGGRRRAGRPDDHRPAAPATPRPSASATSAAAWAGGVTAASRRPWSRSSAPPPPGRPRSPSRWPSGSAARWSTPTPCSSTAAWTSAPPSPTSPSAAACRTTCSTSGPSARRPRSPSTAGCARAEIDRLRAAGVVPLLVGGSGLYVRAVLDELDFPGTDAAVRARLEGELADVGPGRAARAAGRPRPGGGGGGAAEQRTADRPGAGGDRADRGPVPRAAARAAAALPGGVDRPRPGRPPSSTSGWRCGWTACGRPASSTRCERLAAEGLREGPTASRALGYAQVLAQFDGELTAEEARERTVSHDAAVRPPPAVLVPARRGARLVRRRAARPASTRSPPRSPPVRSER